MVENEGAGHQQHGPQETPAAGTLSHENPASGKQCVAKRDYTSAREWTRLIIEILGLIGLVYYVRQSAIQATASKDAADAAREAAKAATAAAETAPNHLELSQRPRASSELT